ncbi:S-adenosyl-L-methionine-dependent methyltransferase [Lichtheimia hyalospora FSU 10163]|nr:S-adenosyl-L-methionine-dependent methyltransferase [Lichtheimia hyalospora FSU 10163]
MFSNAHMMVSETQGKLLHQLAQLVNARRVLEIGTFTGYSTLAMASALPDNDTTATVISLDRNEQAQSIAKKYIQGAQLEKKVNFRLGNGLDLLQDLVQEEPSRQFDLIFLDANKSGYIPYFDYIMDHNMLADRGIIIADNVLFFGQVHRVAGYDDTPLDASKNILGTAKKAHKFNQHVLSDPRVQVVVLPIFDGVSIIRKR